MPEDLLGVAGAARSDVAGIALANTTGAACLPAVADLAAPGVGVARGAACRGDRGWKCENEGSDDRDGGSAERLSPVDAETHPPERIDPLARFLLVAWTVPGIEAHGF
jgi:hypothetical protein